jgi:hypothetical protein
VISGGIGDESLQGIETDCRCVDEAYLLNFRREIKRLDVTTCVEDHDAPGFETLIDVHGFKKGRIHDNHAVRRVDLILLPDGPLVEAYKSNDRGASTFKPEEWEGGRIFAFFDKSAHKNLGGQNNALASTAVDSDFFHRIS